MARGELAAARDLFGRDEALEALRMAPQYYFLPPQHFIVADESGRSFVYEWSPARNIGHVVCGDVVQIVTNHLLHRYPRLEDLPAGDGPAERGRRGRVTRTHGSASRG